MRPEESDKDKKPVQFSIIIKKVYNTIM